MTFAPVRLGYLVSARSGKAPVLTEDGEFPVFGAGGQLGTSDQANAGSGDLIIGRVGSVGSIRLARTAIWATDNTIILTIDLEKADPRFLVHCVAQIPIGQLTSGTAMPLLTANKLVRSMISVPPLHQQRAIADYLDDEAAQVDMLIAKQNQLVALLRERRAESIAGIVRIGLDTNVSTRESDVPWLGPIKANWDMARMRHVVDVGTGYGDTIDAEPDGEYPFYVRSQAPLRSTTYDHEGPAVLTAGDGAGVAKVFHLAHGKFKAHQRVYVLDNFRRVLPEYVLAYFSSNFSRVALDGSAKSTVDSVRRPMITDMPITIPPLDEQMRIVERIKESTTKIDLLISKAEQFIALAKERRAALITAAVTGQIDVSTSA